MRLRKAHLEEAIAGIDKGFLRKRSPEGQTPKGVSPFFLPKSIFKCQFYLPTKLYKTSFSIFRRYSALISEIGCVTIRLNLIRSLVTPRL